MSATQEITKVDTRQIWTGRPFFQAEILSTLPRKPLYSAIKRIFDIFCAAIGLTFFLIPMIIIAVVIRIDSPGNPIYLQKRLGKNQKPFTIIKFRTMVQNSEEKGARWAEKDDPRSTRIGRLLRHSHLDELPQLLNILAGQMSFVGPRPERPEFYDLFDTYIGGFRQRMMVTPGLTGLAQINGGYELLPEEKIIYDLDYIKHRSVGLDCRCLMKTFVVVFTRHGAM